MLVFPILCLIAPHVLGTFDVSNLDAANFQYFKYPPTTTQKPIFFRDIYGDLYSIRKKPDPPTKFSRLEDAKNRVKAIFVYFKNLLMGIKKHKIKSKHVIDPEVKNEIRERFQAKHGKFAEKLINFLGQGPHSHENLVRAGVI